MEYQGAPTVEQGIAPKLRLFPKVRSGLESQDGNAQVPSAAMIADTKVAKPGYQSLWKKQLTGLKLWRGWTRRFITAAGAIAFPPFSLLVLSMNFAIF